MADQSPRGLIASLITPLDPNRNIDRESLKSLLEYMMNDRFWVLIGSGDIGEGFAMDNGKRRELMRVGMETVQGRIPLFLNITGDTEDQTGENIVRVEKSIKDLNYNGDIFLLDSPLWYHSNKGLPGLYDALARVTRLPIVLYNNPFLITELKKHLKHKNIRTNILKQLSKNEQIIGIVHVGDLKRAINYSRAVRERRGFRIYDGNELNFLAKPSSDGVVALGANILPMEWKEITESSIHPKETLRDQQTYHAYLWEVGQLLRSLHHAYIPNPTAIIKSALKSMGKIEWSTVTEYTETATPDQELKIQSLLAEYGIK